jgi:hypothetical protein
MPLNGGKLKHECEKMEERSSNKRQGETLVCPVCGSVNKVGSEFCDSCGNPLTIALHSDLETGRVPEIALGYATSIRSQKESIDSLVVLDMNFIFVSEQQRRILCVIVKGLKEFIEGKKIACNLLSHTLPKKSTSAYQTRLSELQKELYKKLSEAQLSGKVRGNDTGFLISVIDGRHLTYISSGAPRSYVLNAKGFRELPKGSVEDSTARSEVLEDGDYVCMHAGFANIFEKKEAQEIILRAENPQKASNVLLQRALEKNPNSVSNFSIVIAQIVGNP